MSGYRIFKRAWWRDPANTIPEAGKKTYTGQWASTEDEARRMCRANNLRDFGNEHGRGHRGVCSEFESC